MSAELREQSIGELLGRLSEQMSALVRQEVELAKVELREKGRRAGAGAGLIGAGGLLGLGAFAALTTTLILVLATFLDAWLAALIVTVAYAAGAAALAVSGKQKVQAISPVPEQTIETLKEDARWAKTQLGSDSR